MRLILLFDDVAEDVVENEVAVGLGCEDESLGELAVRLRLVGDLADDLDDDVGVGGLRVDVGDADLALVEVELFYPVVDGLRDPESASILFSECLLDCQACLPSVPHKPAPCPSRCR